ncbi:MAG: hypothetical protein GX801_10060 [Fibrobacter sp.]|nr:hypothetical protein [Fibrobacter sp.]
MKRILISLIAIALVFGCSSSNPNKVAGYKVAETPTTELDAIKKALNKKNVMAEIGIGESTDEMVAMTIAQDAGRAAIGVSMGDQVKRLSEQYVQNVSGEAKQIWEEKTNHVTAELLRGTTAMKSITLYNEEKASYKIYTLMVLDPGMFKEALNNASAGNDELELRVKSADMQQRLDEAVKEYQQHYGR